MGGVLDEPVLFVGAGMDRHGPGAVEKGHLGGIGINPDNSVAHEDRNGKSIC